MQGVGTKRVGASIGIDAFVAFEFGRENRDMQRMETKQVGARSMRDRGRGLLLQRGWEGEGVKVMLCTFEHHGSAFFFFFFSRLKTFSK